MRIVSRHEFGSCATGAPRFRLEKKKKKKKQSNLFDRPPFDSWNVSFLETWRSSLSRDVAKFNYRIFYALRECRPDVQRDIRISYVMRILRISNFLEKKKKRKKIRRFLIHQKIVWFLFIIDSPFKIRSRLNSRSKRVKWKVNSKTIGVTFGWIIAAFNERWSSGYIFRTPNYLEAIEH